MLGPVHLTKAAAECWLSDAVKRRFAGILESQLDRRRYRSVQLLPQHHATHQIYQQLDHLDHVYNCAVSHLRDLDSGVVRQMEHSIKAINDERLRRRERWPLAVSIVCAIIALVSLALNFWVCFAK
jgi:hypothetical protein